MIKLSNKLLTALLFFMLAATGSAVTTAAEEATVDPASVSAEVAANMQKMHEQMSAIHATKDSKERARLMDEHMKTMQNTLPMMQHEKGCMMIDKGTMGKHMMKDGKSAQGINMMQMMMDQMSQHQHAMQEADK